MKNLRSLIYFTLLMGSISCSNFHEESMEMKSEINLLENSKRLVFNNYVDFESAIKEIANTNDKAENLEIISKYIAVPKEFISLNQFLDNYNKSGNKQNFKISESGIDPEILDEFVPDQAFASVLNEDLEIEVNGYLYKVTQFGTFYTEISNSEKLFDAISNFDKNELLGMGNSNGRIVPSEDPDGGDLKNHYILADDVYLVDTFYDFDYDEDLISSAPAPSNQNIILQPDYFCGACAPITPTALPKAAYDKFEVHKFGAQTAVGKFFESFLGTNTGFTLNYSTNYRLKVKLYAFNYGVYKSVGLNAKMQKRGWTGLWARHNDSRAEKLVLGWDVLYFNIKIPYAMPVNYTSFPSKKVGKEILKFSNFSLTTANITDVSIPFLNISKPNYNELEKQMDKIIASSLGKLTELVWKEAEKSLSPASYEVKQEEIKTYRKIFPDKIKFMISRVETQGTNSNNISFVIDRHFQVNYNSTGNAQYNSWHENILSPTLQSSKKMYEIEGASVFGAAIFNGQTKGIRIIKELE